MTTFRLLVVLLAATASVVVVRASEVDCNSNVTAWRVTYPDDFFRGGNNTGTVYVGLEAMIASRDISVTPNTRDVKGGDLYKKVYRGEGNGIPDNTCTSIAAMQSSWNAIKAGACADVPANTAYVTVRDNFLQDPSIFINMCVAPCMWTAAQQTAARACVSAADSLATCAGVQAAATACAANPCKNAPFAAVGNGLILAKTWDQIGISIQNAASAVGLLALNGTCPKAGSAPASGAGLWTALGVAVVATLALSA